MGNGAPIPLQPPARPPTPTITAPAASTAPTAEKPAPPLPPDLPVARTPAPTGRRTFWGKLNRAGTIISMATLDLDSRRIAFWSRYSIPVRGDVATDLRPGLHRVTADPEKREFRWPASSVPSHFEVKLTGVAHPFDLVLPPDFPVLAHRGFPATGPESFESTKQRVVAAVSGNRFADAYEILDRLGDLPLHDVVDEIWIDHAGTIGDLLRNFKAGMDAKAYDMMRILWAIECYSVESRSRLYADNFLEAVVHPDTWKRDPAREAAKLSTIKLAFTYNVVPMRAMLVYADDITADFNRTPAPPSYGRGELLYPELLNAATTPKMLAAKRRLVNEIETQNIAFFQQAWKGVEVVTNLVMVANTLTTAVTSAIAAAPGAAPISAAVAAEREMGSWIRDFENGQNMTEADALYQMRAANAPGTGVGFYRGAVQFDGRDLTTRTLLEVKNWKDGEKMATALTEGKWWAGQRVLNQALRQLAARGSYSVVWRMSGRQAAGVVQQIFRANNLPIEVVVFP